MTIVACLFVLGFGALPATAQGQGAAGPQWDALPGLYELDDGRLVEIFDLIDQAQQHLLVAIEPRSGRVRPLFPVEDAAGARPGSSFEAGAAFIERRPPGYSLRFTWSGDQAAGVVLEEEGVEVIGSRVRFEEREVVFESGDLMLAGTLVLPAGPGPHPGLVMVHGSGPVTRRAPRYMADLFAHRGIAVLVYDKRGTGESTGDWRTASLADLADDVSAALDRLLKEPDIDPDRVGLFGSSEAGYIAPVVAARDDRVSLIVCRVCPGQAQRELAPVLQRIALERAGLPGGEIDAGVAFHEALVAYSVERTGYAELKARYERQLERPWMGRYGFDGFPPADDEYWNRLAAAHVIDPVPLYRELEIPVLVVLGEMDAHIPVEPSRRRLLDAARLGNPRLEVAVMARAGHGLMEVRSGPEGESLPPVRYAPAFHPLVMDWVERHFMVQ